MSKSLAKNAFYKLFLNIFNIIVPLLVGSYATRILQSKEMGDVNYAQSIYQYFYIFATFGIYQYGLREISRVRDNKEKLSRVFTNLFIITLITNVVTSIVYVLFINIVFKQSDIYIIALIMTMNFFSNIFYVEWVAEGLEEFDFITIKTIIIQSIYSILVFIFVKSADDTDAYVYLLAIALFANYIVSYIYIKKKIKFNFNEIELGKHIKPMILVVILSNANILYTNLDKVMLGSILTTDVVALYTMSLGIAYIVNNLLLTFVQVTIPRLSFYLSHGDDEGYVKLLNIISRIYLMILFPASIGLFVVARECILLYGGSGYVDAIPLMSCFAFYMITTGYENILSNQVMYLNGKEKEQVRYVFMGGLINLILNSILYFMGIFSGITVVLTTIIANSILVTLEYYYVRKKLKLKINLFGFDKIKYLIIALIFIPVTIILRKFVSGVIISLLVIALVNIIIYFAILFIIKDELLLEGIEIAKETINKKLKR